MGFEISPTDFISEPISPQIFSNRVSNIIKILAATRKLELFASTGPLTCAYYRKNFMETGDNKLLRSKWCDHLSTILMLDINHFKAANHIPDMEPSSNNRN
jgi:GGDEF domain-containing protein